MRLAFEEGYALVGTCNEWMNAAARQLGPAVKINRVNIRRHFSTAAFRKIIEGDPSFYLRRQLRTAFLLAAQAINCPHSTKARARKVRQNNYHVSRTDFPARHRPALRPRRY